MKAIIFSFCKNVEPWEDLKTEADMEYYEWENNASKKSIEALFGKCAEEIPNIDQYSTAVSNLMNEGSISVLWLFFLINSNIFLLILGESEYTVTKYGEAVRNMLGLPSLNQSW